MKNHQRRVLTVVGAALVILLGSIIFEVVKDSRKDSIVIGTTEYIEERIVSQLYAQVIEDRTGIDVELNNAMGSTLVTWEALLNGELDMVPGYTGTYYASVLGLEIYPGMERDQTYQDVSDALLDFGVTAAGQLGPNNQYVFAVKPEIAEKYDLKTVGDLAPLAPNMVVGCSQSFYARENDGLFPACDEYGLKFKDALTFGAAPMYIALENDEVDVIVTYRTDGLLQKYDLVFLEDDHSFFPPYVLFSMLGEEVMEEHPEVLDACMELNLAVTDEEMQDMNYRGAQDGEEPYTIAREFLLEKGLISE